MTKTWDDAGIDASLLRNPNGEQKIPCPKCGPYAKNPSKTDLSVNTATGTWNCWNDGVGCGFKGSLGGGIMEDVAGSSREVHTAVPKNRPQEYRRISRADYVNQTQPLPQEALDWLHARGIGDETINWCGLRWGTITKDSESGQWIRGIFFPYVVQRGNEDPYIANIKKRCLCCKSHMGLVPEDKSTKQKAELIFYGLTNVAETTLIVEGELDALACYEAGVKNVISVPNGATLKSDTARLSYIDACKPELDRVKHVIIAVDDDQPGHYLKQELARRLGPQRCSYVSYPAGCKDFNDVLLHHGANSIREMIQQTKPFPTEGIIRPLDVKDDFLEWRLDDRPSGYSTGWKCLDEHYRPMLGQLNIITGIPSHGKSQLVDALLVNLWKNHHWRAVVFSPESYPLKEYLGRLAEKLFGKTCKESDVRKWKALGYDAEQMTDEEADKAPGYLQDGFSWVQPELDGEGHTLESLLEFARTEIYRFGAKVLVIDPFNEIEHHIPRGMAKTDYIGLSLMKIRRFARYHQVCVFVVAHPTKLERRPEKFEDDKGKAHVLMVEPMPTAYDIEGSANWYNKADNILVVWRDKYAEIRGGDPNLNTVEIQKIKNKSTGRPGTIQLRWDPPTGRYLSPDGETDDDRTNLAAIAVINQILGDDW